MPKTRSLSARRWSKWPVALILGVAAAAPVVTAMVAGCGSSDSGTSQGSQRQATWPASQSTMDALPISTWRATFDGAASTQIHFEGLGSDGKVVWSVTYRTPDDGAAVNGQAAFIAPAGEMDFGAGGITVNTLDAASKYGLSALSYDLAASGVNLPVETPGSLTGQSRTLRILNEGLVSPTDSGSDSGLVAKADSGLVDGGDSGLVEAGTDPLVCALQALLGAVVNTLGSFLSGCSNVGIKVSFSSTGVSSNLASSCGGLGQQFVNSAAAGLNKCVSGGEGGATSSGDGSSSTSTSSDSGSFIQDGGLVSSSGGKLVGNMSDASGGGTGASSGSQNPGGSTGADSGSSGDDSSGDDDTTPMDSGTTTTTPDSGTTTTTPDSGTTTTTPDAGTTTTTTPDSGTTTTTTTDAGTIMQSDGGVLPPVTVPYGATGYVVIDDAINSDNLGVACTATLISSYVAVTSASCLYVHNAQGGLDAPWTRHRFAFGQGVVSDQTRSFTREAIQVVAHPDYQPVDGGPIDTTKDVGLMFLLPAPNGSTLTIAKLSTAPLTVGTMASGVGYGLTSASQQVNGVPNANFRKAFPFTIGAPDGPLFQATVGSKLVLCNGDQGSAAYDTASGSMLGILTSASVNASCTPGTGGNYLTLSSFTPFETCTVQRVADQTSTYSGPTDCR